MNLLNIFRSKKSQIDTPITDSEPVVTEQVFVDNHAPVSVGPETRESNLSAFLCENFENRGFNDGYSYPNKELMEAEIRRLGTKFREAIDRELDNKREIIQNIQLHCIRVKGISEILDAELQLRMKQLENLIHELDTQKVLSIENEGMLAPVVQSYKVGFIKGLERYNQEQLFAGSAGIFSTFKTK